MALHVSKYQQSGAPLSLNAAELLSSHQQFAQLLECLGEGVLLGDRDDKVMYANNRMGELIGYSPAELVGKTIHTLLVPASESWYLKERTERRLNGISETYEIKLQRRDGSRFWAKITATPFRNAEGEIIGTVGAVSDITNQRKADEALRKSEERFRRYFELSLIGIAITSPRTEWIDVNERFCSLLGYTREELFELPWPALTHPEDVERDLSLFRDVLSGKREEYSLDKRYVRKDGSIVHCQLSVGCVRGLDSQIEYFIALIQDISERVNAETELRFQKNFLRQIIDTNPSLIFTKNSVGKFTLVNQAVADIYATTVHDLIGKSDADFNNDHSQLQQFAAEDKLVLDHSIVRSIKEEPVTDARTGETRWFQTIKKPLPDPATGGSQVLGVATDITERKRAEEQALALQQQLHHSQKLEAIGQLASGIAHDLNNALSAVVGHLQLIQMEAQHAGIQQSVSIALTGCERASSLINQLLGFARHGRGDIKPVNLPNLTRETLSFLERVVGPDISIMLTGAETPLMVLADAAQMQQALTNLIINACQAMPNGGKLSISFKKQFCHQGSLKNRLAVAGEYAVIQVKDTGIGMSKATLEKIFEPFFTTKGESNGTGLGLFTVFGMVQHLHGWLEVESELNKGTEFSIYLPIATVTSESIDNVSQPLAPQHVVRPHRLMIVDDEQVLLDLSLDFFRRAGFTCQNFNDPLVALEWYKTHSHEIDYVILDLKMPKMDGAVLFEELKKINPCIRGVILSGYIRETTLSALQALGVSKIFTKPLKLDALLRWIQQDEQHCVVSLKSTN